MDLPPLRNGVQNLEPPGTINLDLSAGLFHDWGHIYAPGIWTRYDTRLLVFPPDKSSQKSIEFSNAFIELGYRLLANANVPNPLWFYPRLSEAVNMQALGLPLNDL
jgi:hypothetical protein